MLKYVTETNRLVVLTSRGRGVAMIQLVADYEKNEEEGTCMRVVVKGLADLEAVEEVSLSDARARLSLRPLGPRWLSPLPRPRCANARRCRTHMSSKGCLISGRKGWPRCSTSPPPSFTIRMREG